MNGEAKEPAAKKSRRDDDGWDSFEEAEMEPQTSEYMRS